MMLQRQLGFCQNFIWKYYTSFTIPRRSIHKNAKIQMSKEVMTAVTGELTHKVEDSSLLLVKRSSPLLEHDLFPEYGFRKLWVTAARRKTVVNSLSDHFNFLEASPYIHALDFYLATLDTKNSPFYENKLAWGEEESSLCVVWEVENKGTLHRVMKMHAEPSLYFPCGRVPHFLVAGKKIGKMLLKCKKSNVAMSLSALHSVFDVQSLKELPGEYHLLKMAPRSNLYSEIVDDPADVSLLKDLCIFLNSKKEERLIPLMESYFPDVGYSLLESGFRMDTGVKDLDFTKLHLFIKLLKRSPKYNSEQARSLFEMNVRATITRRWKKNRNLQ